MTKTGSTEYILCPECNHSDGELDAGLMRGHYAKTGLIIDDGFLRHMMTCVQCHHVFSIEDYWRGRAAGDSAELVE